MLVNAHHPVTRPHARGDPQSSVRRAVALPVRYASPSVAYRPRPRGRPSGCRVRRAIMTDGPQCAACVCQIMMNYVFGNFNRINPIRSLILDPCCVPCASIPAASRRRPRMPQSVCHSNGHRITSHRLTTTHLPRHDKSTETTRNQVFSVLSTVSRIVTLPPLFVPFPSP